MEKIVLGGGCFWCTEAVFKMIDGVTKVTPGYAGGDTKNPTYKNVCSGTTGHAESLLIVFQPDKLPYKELLKFFFRMHDPTTKDRQGNDRGSQYRSAIFYHSETQKHCAKEMMKTAAEKWGKPVVTELVPAAPFFIAEDYHQDYLLKNPEGYTCHWLRNW